MARTNIIDRAIAAVAPGAALRRAAARRGLELMNSGYGNYGANTTKKSMRGWLYGGGSAKEDIEDNLDILRQRSRDAYMGVPTAAAALKTLRTNVIASGLVPAPKLDADFLGLGPEAASELQAKIIREFSLWADTSACDADGFDNFYQLQQLAFLSVLMNGDAFALLQERERPGAPYALQVRLIEADRVCSPDGYDRLSPCEVRGHQVERIVQGVETDWEGAVKAYWIRSTHPLSAQAWQGGGYEEQWQRVLARDPETGRRNLLHIMTRERAGQVRGVPLLAPVLETLKELGRYTEAEVTAAVISSYTTVFVKEAEQGDGLPFGQLLPPEERIEPGSLNTLELGPGIISALGPGEDLTTVDPKHPNTEYSTFTDALIRQIGAAVEVPQEVLQKHFSTSYSAARGALNEFWRVCGMWREWFADDFCRPIYEQWFAEAAARRRIPAAGFFSDPARRKAYTETTWNGPARTSLNPLQEVQAAALRVEMGFSTAQEETAQMSGGDYDINIRQRLVEAVGKRAVDEIAHPQETTAPVPEREEENT